MVSNSEEDFTIGPSTEDIRSYEGGGAAQTASASISLTVIASKFKTLVTAASAWPDGLNDATGRASPAERFQLQLSGMRKDLDVLCRALRGSPNPKVGDLVCGSLHVELDVDVVLWFHLYGSVTQTSEIGNAWVKFNDFEAMDDGGIDSDAFVANYLNVDLTFHAADMEWDDGGAEWYVDL